MLLGFFLLLGGICMLCLFLLIMNANSKPSITITMETRTEPTPVYCRPPRRKKNCRSNPPSWLLPEQPSAMRGWTNLGKYEVHGTNPKTKRSNKRIYSALTETQAEAKAASEGLVAPFQVKEIPSRPMSEPQCQLLKKMKYSGSYTDLSLVDAGAIISYVFDGDRRLITAEEWASACEAGYEISALSGPTMYHKIMSTGDWRANINND